MQRALMLPILYQPINLSIKFWRILLSVIVFLTVLIGTVACGEIGQAIVPTINLTQPDRELLQAASSEQAALIPASGGLIVQNRSPHPVRVVLLSRSVKKQLDTQPKDEVPAHWDFAPWEGRLNGVLVVLSERTVRLKPGDVVVAFAQDGSRQYWGPFVAGETPEPKWDQEKAAWRMVLGE